MKSLSKSLSRFASSIRRYDRRRWRARRKPRRTVPTFPISASRCEDKSFSADIILKEMRREASFGNKGTPYGPLTPNGFLRAHTYSLVLQEGKQIGVDLVRVGCGHAVRKAFVGFQCAIP